MWISDVKNKTRFRIKEHGGHAGDTPAKYVGKIGIMIESEFPEWKILLDDGEVFTFVQDECMYVGRTLEEIEE